MGAKNSKITPNISKLEYFEPFWRKIQKLKIFVKKPKNHIFRGPNSKNSPFPFLVWKKSLLKKSRSGLPKIWSPTPILAPPHEMWGCYCPRTPSFHLLLCILLFQTARNIYTKLCSSFIGSRVCTSGERKDLQVST